MIFQNTKKSQAPSYTCSHRFSSVKMLREYSITKEIMQGTSYRATTHAVSFWNTSYTGTYYAGGISPVSGMVEGDFISIQLDLVELGVLATITIALNSYYPLLKNSIPEFALPKPRLAPKYR